jgi:hypothetical protein
MPVLLLWLYLDLLPCTVHLPGSELYLCEVTLKFRGTSRATLRKIWSAGIPLQAESCDSTLARLLEIYFLNHE